MAANTFTAVSVEPAFAAAAPESANRFTAAVMSANSYACGLQCAWLTSRDGRLYASLLWSSTV